MCAFYKAGTEIPSDFSVVLFIPMDEHDGWKFLLAKELKKVIPSVDLNLL